MKNPRVAHIITRLIVGGAQENTVFTVQGLRQSGDYDCVDLIAGPELGKEGNLLDHYPCPGLITARHLIRNLHPWHDILAVFELVKILRNGNYDIVHTHSSKAGILGRIAARIAGTKVIVHTIHGLAFDQYRPRLNNLIYILAERFCARMSDKIICVSDEMSKQALQAKVGHAELYETIRSGNDMSKFLKDFNKEDILEKYSIPKDRFLIGKVARFFEFKGHEYLLPIAKELGKKYPDILFVLVGGGPLMESFREETKKLGVENMFHFTGLVKPDDVPEIVSAMDLIIHLSLREGLARVIPQAMILGKPVISFDLGAAAEVIEQDRTGFVVAPKDLKDTAQKIEFFYNNKDKTVSYGAAGQKRAQTEFDKDLMWQKISELYQKLITQT